MREFLWRAVARIVSQPRVTDWLIARAQRTPYIHIHGKDGSLYMGRWWLFNPYQPHSDGAGRKWSEWLPSIRIHHICRPDSDRHLHDHPWNARTIVLRGGYKEERPVSGVPHGVTWTPVWTDDDRLRAGFTREPGYTGQLLFGEYHRISHIPEGGAWTLFITWRKRGTWGFLVDGQKVPWREYLGEQG
ncbi:MAG TPA: hypothetical protein VEB23_10465 [Ramlibacter sp.]|nr:hypothetical protein [Ramlibacter sp.]